MLRFLAESFRAVLPDVLPCSGSTSGVRLGHVRSTSGAREHVPEHGAQNGSMLRGMARSTRLRKALRAIDSFMDSFEERIGSPGARGTKREHAPVLRTCSGPAGQNARGEILLLSSPL